jgi:guanine nucleotide-binding protein subunit alpha
MEQEEEGQELPDSASVSDGQTITSVPSDPEIHRIAAEKHAEYTAALRPVFELEERLIHRLGEDDDEDEATRLGDGSTPGWSSVPRGEYAVRTTSNWKRALTLRRNRSNRTSTSTPWWEDPSDPVHVLDTCRDAMIRLWKDEWVRHRLVEKRVRLRESSGLCVFSHSLQTHPSAKLSIQLSR